MWSTRQIPQSCLEHVEPSFVYPVQNPQKAYLESAVLSQDQHVEPTQTQNEQQNQNQKQSDISTNLTRSRPLLNRRKTTSPVGEYGKDYIKSDDGDTCDFDFGSDFDSSRDYGHHNHDAVTQRWSVWELHRRLLNIVSRPTSALDGDDDTVEEEMRGGKEKEEEEEVQH